MYVKASAVTWMANVYWRAVIILMGHHTTASSHITNQPLSLEEMEDTEKIFDAKAKFKVFFSLITK